MSRRERRELQKLGYQVSLRRIRKYMNSNGLVSNYTVKQFKVHKKHIITKNWNLYRYSVM